MSIRIALIVWVLPRNIAIAWMKLYRLVISPLYGQVCKYHPSCSRYALESYQLNGFIRGTLLTGWRVLRCNPWSSGGIDDPPRSNSSMLKVSKRGFVVPVPSSEFFVAQHHQTEDVIHP